MELPNKAKAQVALEKIVDYLLSETHPVGKSKAKYFRSHGFDDQNADLLAEGLLKIAKGSDVERSESSLFGVKYILSGELQTPTGDRLRVKTIWIIEKENGYPRFVTAYPAE
jgi:hypothetical protein